MNIELYPKFILKALLFIFSLLLLANIIGLVFKLNFGNESIYGLIRLFDFDRENNIPTFYSSLILLAASILLSFIASAHKKTNSPYIYWAILSAIFLFLSIDEISSIHEKFTAPVRELLNTSGSLFLAWVVPYGIFSMLIALSYIRFLMNLPKDIMILFVCSGAIYITGAIGFEILGAPYYESHGNQSLIYSFFYTCEESFEMIGIAIFIYAILRYITSQFKFLKITVFKK